MNRHTRSKGWDNDTESKADSPRFYRKSTRGDRTVPLFGRGHKEWTACHLLEKSVAHKALCSVCTQVLVTENNFYDNPCTATYCRPALTLTYGV